MGAWARSGPAGWSGVTLAFVVASLATGWPAPIGIVVLGAVIGSLIAFIAIGLVLIYRTNRIINFAGADIGATAAMLTVMLVTEAGLGYWAGVGTGIAAAVVLAGLIEVVVVRRFARAPRLVLTVATLALAQLLVFVQLILPQIFTGSLISPDLPTPFGGSFRIGDPHGATSVLFDGDHIMAIVMVPVVIAALGAFFRLTRVGVAARAAAENAERASLLGIPVKRISTIVWCLAGGLAAIGALLRAPTIGLSLTGNAFGPGLLVRALAPAVVGGMRDLRTTFAAAVALGIVDQAFFFRTGDPALANLVLFGVIFAGLLFRRGARGRLERTDASSWQVLQEIRPVPRELRAVPEVRIARRLAPVVLFGGLVVAGAALPALQLGFLALILIFAIVGVSLVMLTGWAGQISLGQMGFAAVGAASAGTLIADRGWNVLGALGVAGLAGAAIAIVIGVPALRVRGLFLAASTVAFGLVVSTVVLNPTYAAWLVPDGRIERPSVFGLSLTGDRAFYFFVLALTALVLGSARSVRRSRLGRVLIAARDNEAAARSFGVGVTGARIAAFAMSGFCAALAGGLFALHQNTVIPSAFDVEVSLQVFVMVVIGGLGSLPGALLGAASFYGARFLLPAPWSLLVTGFGMLVVLMVAPGGLGQVVYERRDRLLRWVARRRSIVVPSLVADVRVDEPSVGRARAGGGER